MPLYEYRCRGCEERFEILQRLGEGGEGLSCPRCGEAAPQRQFSTFAAATGGSSRQAGGFEGDCGSGAGSCCRGPGFSCEN